jgi:hypothetical protein
MLLLFNMQSGNCGLSGATFVVVTPAHVDCRMNRANHPASPMIDRCVNLFSLVAQRRMPDKASSSVRSN